MQPPFISGNPVSTESFISRQREMRRVVGRILNYGQSSAVIGEPRSGKTSFLQYVTALENRMSLYGEEEKNLLFSYVDSQALGRHFTPAQFWQHVLVPVEDSIGKAVSPLQDAYLNCIKEDCGNFVLERLFGQLFLAGKRLVLLLDEFEAFLDNDIFHQSEFYGGLRSLASRSKGLILVIASRQSLSQLNHGTQGFNRTGSPYFNFLDEILLRPFSQKAIDDLLDLAGERFSKKDREFIQRLAGGHPYFLQVLSSKLWEIYADYDEENEEGCREGEKFKDECYKLANEEFYEVAKDTLSDIWRLWSPEMRKAFVTVALDEMPIMLCEKSFRIPNLLNQLPTYSPELADLKRRGFIKEDTVLDGGYCVTAEIMLKFVSDELLRALRKGDDLGNYFHEEEWDGLFTIHEKKQYAKAAKNLYAVFNAGVDIYAKLAGL